MKDVETKEKKRLLLDELRKSRGIIKTACKNAGVSRPTCLKWRDNDPEFKSEFDEISEEQIDEVESTLLANILKGDTTAAIFYLKTKGRNRGYGNMEVSEAVGAENTPKAKADPVAMRRLGGIKAGLVKALKKDGKYSDGLKYQIDSVAQLMLRVDELKQEIFDRDHKCVNVETSREGNVRESVSPKERLYLEYLRQMQYSLRALGLNMDSKAQKGADNDGFDEFMKNMKE